MFPGSRCVLWVTEVAKFWQSPRQKPNPTPALAILPRVRRLRLPNLSLQYPLRHQPTLWVRVRAACLNHIHANVENITTTEALR